MTNRILKTAGLFCFSLMVMAAVPGTARADQESLECQAHAEVIQEGPKAQADTEAVQEGPKAQADTEAVQEGPKARTGTVAVQEGPKAQAEAGAVKEAPAGASMLVQADMEDAAVSEPEVEEAPAETPEEAAARASEERRRAIADYGLQFVGNRYVYGGTDPNKGADCSGFTSYVMRHAAGVELPRSSRSQALQGREISTAEMRPGDLLFYGTKKRINHVAMYIGNGQVVHASNERTGICVSEWNYRTPVKVVNVLGD